MRCTRYKRVRVRGQGTAKRCAKYSGGKRRASSSGSRRKGSKRRKSAYKRGHRPFNKGKKCVSMGRSRSGRPVCRSYGAVRRRGLRLPASAGTGINRPPPSHSVWARAFR